MLDHTILEGIVLLVCAILVSCQNNGDVAVTKTIEDPSVSDNFENPSLNYDYNYDDNAIAVTYLRKCQCKVSELLQEGQCVEHELLVQSVKNTEFNVTIEDLSCQPPMIPIVLSANDFSPVEGGSIHVSVVDAFVPIEEHCIEYIYNAFGEVSMEAKVCTVPPILPACCSDGSNPIINSEETMSCVEGDETGNTVPKFKVPVYIGESPADFGFLDSQQSRIICSEHEKLTSVDLVQSDHAVLGYSATGVTLEWMAPRANRIIFHLDEFCLANRSSTEPPTDVKNVGYEGSSSGDATSEISETVSAYFCHEDPVAAHLRQCGGKTCVRKCCPPGSVFFASVGCAMFDDPGGWLPTIHSSHTMEPLVDSVNITEVHGLPICSDYYTLDPDDSFILTDDSNLNLLSFGQSFTSDRYCIDNIIDDNGTATRIALVCFANSEGNPCSWQRIMQVVALAFSCLFIVITIFVYVSVTEIFRRLPSKCVLSESFALLLSFLSLIVLQGINTEETSIFCIATGESHCSLIPCMRTLFKSK